MIGASESPVSPERPNCSNRLLQYQYRGSVAVASMEPEGLTRTCVYRSVDSNIVIAELVMAVYTP
jgi:hypothetical protein